jgi:xanthine dehydrogenase accessory factor
VTDWLLSLRDALMEEPRVMIVTVAATRGSVPREAGTRMIVGAAMLRGTIGGGHLEFDAIRIARDALAAHDSGGDGGGNWLVRFPLAARLGQCCGGVATLMFQPVSASASWPAQLFRERSAGNAVAMVVGVGTPSPAVSLVTADTIADCAEFPANVNDTLRKLLAKDDAGSALIPDGEFAWYAERVVANDFNVIVFGNGHVGRALIQVLATLPCAVKWVDQREHDFPTVVPANTTTVASDTPEDEVIDAPAGSWFVVMTHSHALDFELTARILARGDFAYFGLIGSASKRAQFEKRLAARGSSNAAMARITCPIGIGTIRSKEPGAIAIAVAAELLQLRERAAARDIGKTGATAAVR